MLFMCAVVAVGMTNCGEEGSTMSAPVQKACAPFPLEQFCSVDGCTTYDAAESSLRRFAASANGGCEAALGRCGDLRYTYIFSVGGSTTMFFDPDGRLLAAVTTSHHIEGNDPCSGATLYGSIPACQREVVERLCPQ
jgi:hypothetical protein